ncbi:hypothetical protein ADUPG1_001916, partial [Aduncisulcus paluster]
SQYSDFVHAGANIDSNKFAAGNFSGVISQHPERGDQDTLEKGIQRNNGAEHASCEKNGQADCVFADFIPYLIKLHAYFNSSYVFLSTYNRLGDN